MLPMAGLVSLSSHNRHDLSREQLVKIASLMGDEAKPVIESV